MFNLHGIVPPIVTPMRVNEDLDLDRLETLIDEYLECGVHGLFVLGTTGEFYALSELEKQQVIAAAVAKVNGRVPVLAGTGAETTREVIRLTQIAGREKADAVSVITPYYIHPTQIEIFDHYRRIAESTSLPVVLYNNPAPCGGVRLEPETVAKLAEIPNIVGLKDSAGDLTTLMEFIRLTPPSFAVMQGRDTLIEPALQQGAKGSVPGLANLAPRLCVQLFEAFQHGDFSAAKEAQKRLSPLRLALSLGTAPGTIKIAMKLQGRSAGPSRGPVNDISAAASGKLQAIVNAIS